MTIRRLGERSVKAVTNDETRLAELKAKLAAREGKPEYRENCIALQNEIGGLTVKIAEAAQG